MPSLVTSPVPGPLDSSQQGPRGTKLHVKTSSKLPVRETPPDIRRFLGSSPSPTRNPGSEETLSTPTHAKHQDSWPAPNTRSLQVSPIRVNRAPRAPALTVLQGGAALLARVAAPSRRSHRAPPGVRGCGQHRTAAGAPRRRTSRPERTRSAGRGALSWRLRLPQPRLRPGRYQPPSHGLRHQQGTRAIATLPCQNLEERKRNLPPSAAFRLKCS